MPRVKRTSSDSTNTAQSAEARPTRTTRRTTAKRGTDGRAKKTSTRKGKYNAAGERIDGIFFHSKSEGQRYLQLKKLESEGLIEQLELQPAFPCTVANKKITTYCADFRYRVVDDRGYTTKIVIEDVKGMMTDIYKLKKKLVEACYKIEIVEIPAKDILKWENKIP